MIALLLLMHPKLGTADNCNVKRPSDMAAYLKPEIAVAEAQ